MSDYIMPDQFVKGAEELLKQVPINFWDQARNKLISSFQSDCYKCLSESDIGQIEDKLHEQVQEVDIEIDNLNEMFSNEKKFDGYRKQIQKIQKLMNILSDEVTDIDV